MAGMMANYLATSLAMEKVVSAIATHGHERALGLLGADEPQLLLGRGLRKEIVDTGFRGDGRRGHGIVAGDHDGADTHAAKLGEAIADSAFDDILEMNDAEQFPVLRHGKGRAAGLGDRLGNGVNLSLELGADGVLARGGGGGADSLG